MGSRAFRLPRWFAAAAIAAIANGVVLLVVVLPVWSGCGSDGSFSSTPPGPESGLEAGSPEASDGGFARADSSIPDAPSSVSDAQGGDAATLDSGPSCARPDASAGPTVSGTIAVSQGSSLATVGAGVAGLSYEKSKLAGGLFRGDNAALIAMFRLLGPGVLRVGGNSVDKWTWNGEDAGVPPGDAGPQPNITKADVDALAAFVKAAGWTVIYGVNMKSSTPGIAADEAAYAAGALGSSLYGFEIGNEVDLYPSTLLSPTWSYAIFRGQWLSFASAIRAGGAGAMAPLTGPASASNYKSYTVPFATDEGSRIVLLTQHYYRANGQAATSTLDLLLKPDPNLPTMLQALSTAASTNKIAHSYRCSECNSFYNGGSPGISDAYGTALWAIDFLFTNARYGSSGVNFHGGGNGTGYTPIADANGAVVEARPVFYGMLLFALAGTGPLAATQVTGVTGVNFTAYAVLPSDGSVNVVLVNKDPTTTVHASVDMGKPLSSATVTRLEAPALDATTCLTLGGVPVTPMGTWTPAPPENAAVSGGTATVDVGPASAVLVHGGP